MGHTCSAGHELEGVLQLVSYKPLIYDCCNKFTNSWTLTGIETLNVAGSPRDMRLFGKQELLVLLLYGLVAITFVALQLCFFVDWVLMTVDCLSQS